MSVDLSFLLNDLRLEIGDITVPYRYMDQWLNTALLAAVKALGGWWMNRYLVDSNNQVYRNPNILFDPNFTTEIRNTDERDIVLMATIIILGGSLENNAWNIASWKDQEISYSNITGGKIMQDAIQRRWDELNSRLMPPNKRLARALKGSLPGYSPSGGSGYEHGIRKP